MMTFDLDDLILFLAASQGFFLTLLIFHKHGRLFTNRFLGLLVFLYSVILLYLLLGELELTAPYPSAVDFVLGIGFTVGPLHFLYTKYLTRNATRMSRGDYLHFLPFLVYLLAATLDNLLPAVSYMEEFIILNTTGETTAFSLFNWAVAVHGSTYIILTLFLLGGYRRRIRHVFSTIDRVKLTWLRNFTCLIAACMVIYLLENALLLFGIAISEEFTLSSAVIAFYVYAIGYVSLFKSEVFTLPEIGETIRQAADIQRKHVELAEDTTRRDKYEKSGLTEEKADRIKEQLLKLMEEAEPYTDSELTLNRLAEMLGVSPHNLSEVINTRLRQSFFDFINGYRIERVKRDLADPGKRHLKILAIAFDAGFRSKSSFNTIFKKRENITPSDYRRKVGRPNC